MPTVDISTLFNLLYHQIHDWVLEFLSFLDHIIIIPHLSFLRLLIILIVIGLIFDAILVIIPADASDD